MESAATLLLTNAVCASVLAVPALLVSRLGRRPALAHALWLLVLVKLVTPPLIDLPVFTLAPPPEPVAQQVPEIVPAASDPAPVAEPAEDESPLFLGAIERQEVVIEESHDNVTLDPAPVPPAPWWPMALVSLSLTGTLCWLAVLGMRWRRFQRALTFARPAPKALIEQVYAIAARLELRTVPQVWLVPGRVSPMLWGLLGQPWLLIPTELWATLGREQQETLLLHELAHLKRNDHRVRLLELLVTALYWWHPVVWLARRELREAEEQCCDAWVVWARPDAAKSYATALLECVDFLSQVQTPLPLGASGIGQVNDLKRRLTMIMGRSTPRRMTVAGLVMVVALAAMLLPAMPTWAQQPPPQKQPTKEDADKVKADVEKLRAQLEDQLDKAKETEKKLREAVQKLDQLEQAQGSKRNVRVIIIREGEDRNIGQSPPMGGPGGGSNTPRPGNQNQGQNQGQGGWRQGGWGGGQDWGQRSPQPQPGQPGDRRMEDLEKKLDNLMKELDEVRKQMRNQRPGTGMGPMGGSGGPGSGPGVGPRTGPMGPGTNSGSKNNKSDIEIELERRYNTNPAK